MLIFNDTNGHAISRRALTGRMILEFNIAMSKEEIWERATGLVPEHRVVADGSVL